VARTGKSTPAARVRVGMIVALLLVGQLVVATRAGAAAGAPAAGVRPRSFGALDCNGFSPRQRLAKHGLECKDPRGLNGEQRFEDNGHYIGHDEPALRFMSSKPGSGTDITWNQRLGVDPRRLPTVAHPGRDVTHFFELSIAPWFSMDLCDSRSFPLTPCTPESDTNAPSATSPGGGAAFLELQFYPPGFAPFVDSISCDNTHWCAAMTIDSLECDTQGNCNPDCVEPVNFAFIQTDGVPAGPPSPQLSDLSTFTPNARTLKMRPGDRLRIHIFNARPHGGGRALETRIDDLSTGRSGFMVASAANGFMNTDFATCNGHPFNFQPEYQTARPENVLPWGIGPYDIDTQFEIGHFEPCTSLRQRQVQDVFGIPDVEFLDCVGPYESATSADSEANGEPDDSPCYLKGDTHGAFHTPPNLVTGCAVFNDAVGDLDFDGTSYWPDWPNSLRPGRFPSPFLQQQPTTRGSRYPLIQFENTVSASEADCDLVTGAGCVLPPPGPGRFYPFWTLGKVRHDCVWEFGQMRNGRTFGGFRQYGSVSPSTMGGFASAIRPNPRRCG
jgi:hypothetical protein